MIIVDTMVFSKLFRPRPDPAVVNRLDRQIPNDLFVTTINQAEMEYGPWAMPECERRVRLLCGITDLFEVDFSGRILPFDSRTALMFGTNIAPARQKHGKDAETDMDGMIAAIAISQDRCRVATRDRRTFEFLGVEVTDTWTEQTHGAD